MNRPLVGVNYFAGWWEESPNKWHDTTGADWRRRFPERVPVLGEYNDLATMVREIDAAADHGVDFFAMLWYYNEADREREPHSRLLNRGLANILAAPNADRLKFYIEFCNHAPYDVTTDAQWNECLAAWLPALRHPSCLRVAGKLVFKVHGIELFHRQHAGDLAQARQRLDKLRVAVRTEGLGEMLIGGGITSGDAANPFTKLFDFTSCYMDVPPLPQRAEDYPYSELAKSTTNLRRRHTQDVIPHMPHLAAGWCPRPWPDARAYFKCPTATEWTAALAEMGADLAAHPGLGLPGQPAFTIYAWNEFGEGGIVAPTKGEGRLKLEAIREVFGLAAASHTSMSRRSHDAAVQPRAISNPAGTMPPNGSLSRGRPG